MKVSDLPAGDRLNTLAAKAWLRWVPNTPCNGEIVMVPGTRHYLCILCGGTFETLSQIIHMRSAPNASGNIAVAFMVVNEILSSDHLWKFELYHNAPGRWVAHFHHWYTASLYQKQGIEEADGKATGETPELAIARAAVMAAGTGGILGEFTLRE